MDNKENIKGIKLRTLNYIMLVTISILYVLAVWQAIDLGKSSIDLIESTNGYIDSRNDAINLRDGSDYLTSEARLFIVTDDIAYCNNYFHEADVDKRRDDAVAGMREHMSDEELMLQLEEALDMSNRLMQKEIYAMRLKADSMGDDLSKYNDRIRVCEISEDDRALTPEEKGERAKYMLFDGTYLSEKAAIDSKVDECVNSILEMVRINQQDNADKLRRTLFFFVIVMSLFLLMSIGVFVVITLWVIRPLNMYRRCIVAGDPLEYCGAYEFDYLAHTYNKIYEINESNKNLLYISEHDSLTGLLNRRAFLTFTGFIENRNSNIALIFVDVDKFKNINDTYGHSVGDEILKKLSKALVAEFRVIDCVARFGGDEFAVIMMNSTSETKEIIRSKMNKINEKMHDTSDGLPAATVSAGVAFSDCGYSEELYRHADEAMYTSKSKGGGSCSFYNKQ